MNNSVQIYSFSIDYWFRYVVDGEQEKDFENVQIKAQTFEIAEQEVLRRFNTPSTRIYSVILRRQTPTLTKEKMFNLTSPKYATK